MKVKKYEAPTMQKALAEVKKDLGSDAVILHTKTKKSNGFMGLWGKEMVEITASKDVNVLSEKPVVKVPEMPKPRPVVKPVHEQTTGALLKYYKKALAVDNNTEGEDSAEKPDLDIKILQSDITEVKSLVHTLLRKTKHADVGALSDEILDAYTFLLEQEVSEKIAREIIERVQVDLKGDEVHNRDLIKKAMVGTVKNMMSFVKPIVVDKNAAVKKIAFVGPTGVGKTTTIAKLAADFALRKQKDVALVTIDTYRIAAVEQLRTYADIINVPLEVVLTPADIKKALEKHSHRDLILIDTAGRSHKNKNQMEELKTFVDVIQPDETHLVLSATTNQKNIKDILARFKMFTVDKLLFTKLDEAVSYGLILNIMSRLNTALSYITMGQNVPDDISVTEPEKLAKLIVEGDI